MLPDIALSDVKYKHGQKLPQERQKIATVIRTWGWEGGGLVCGVSPTRDLQPIRLENCDISIKFYFFNCSRIMQDL